MENVCIRNVYFGAGKNDGARKNMSEKRCGIGRNKGLLKNCKNKMDH